METYARIVDDRAVDVTTLDPTELFHPDVAEQFVIVPDGTTDGDHFDGATWTKAPAAPVAEPAPVLLPKLTPMTFYLSFTPAERIAIKTSTDPVVREFWDTYQRAETTGTLVDPNLVSVQEGLAYLAQGPDILAGRDRIAQILNGQPQ